jgi:DNA-binding MarR family transcriptional regulator
MDEPLSTDDDSKLVFSLFQTTEAITRDRQEELRRYDIHHRRAAVLLVIKDIGDSATPSEIARRLLRRRHSISRLLTKMEQDGLVRKSRDPDNRKWVRVTLTEKGQEAYNNVMRRKSLHKLMSCLSREEHLKMKSYLHTLMERVIKEPGMERLRPILPPSDLDYEMWALLVQTTEAIAKATQNELRRHNIHYRRAAVLWVIKDIGDRATPSEIARRLRRRRHSISRLLSKMEQDGLVRKSKDLDRRNWVRITLTEKGQEAHDKAVRRESLPELMSCLSREERQEMRYYLKTLMDRHRQLA